VKDGTPITKKGNDWSDYSECGEGWFAMGAGYIDHHGRLEMDSNHQECTNTGCRIWVDGGTLTLKSTCLRLKPMCENTSWALSADWKVTSSGHHPNGPTDNIKKVDGYWNSGRNGCVADTWVNWDLNNVYVVGGIAYKGRVSSETLRRFKVAYKEKADDEWTDAFSTDKGQQNGNEQAFTFGRQVRARYLRLHSMDSFRDPAHCELLDYVKWKIGCPDFELKVANGNRVTGEKNGWTDYSRCPEGFNAVGLHYIDNWGRKEADMNHQECDQTGCRGWVDNAKFSVESRCVNAPVADGTEIRTVKNDWSPYSVCPEGSVPVGLAYIDFLGGLEMDGNHEECNATGCRLWTDNGVANIKSRCVVGVQFEVKDGTSITKQGDGWSDYSECPEGWFAMGTGYIDHHGRLEMDSNHQECTFTGCRVWADGGTLTLKSTCLRVKQ